MDKELKNWYAKIGDARQRIEGYVRRTPLIAASPVKQELGRDWFLYLKLENLQIAGSFKARGATNKLMSIWNSEQERANLKGLVTASGGNHGLGVAYAGWLSKKPTTIFLPESTPAAKAAKIESWGATVIRHGKVWDEANSAAQAYATREGLTYFHPFADPEVIAGQGTIGVEMLLERPELDLLLVAIGGGGLISGIALATAAMKSSTKIIGIEPVGAPTLYESMIARKVVELPSVNTRAGTLAPRRSDEMNVNIINRYVSQIVLVTDEEMEIAQRWLWFELGIMAELSAAAAIAALMTGKVKPNPGQRVGVVICGTNGDVEFQN